MKGKNIFSMMLLISAITILGYALIYKPIKSPTPTYDVIRDTVIYNDTIPYYTVQNGYLACCKQSF